MVKSNKSTVRLGDIISDPDYQVRTKVNSTKVAEYTEAMRIGHIFPPMVLEEKTMKIVCGFTRHEAYKRTLTPGDKVPAIIKSFKSIKERMLFSAEDNNHGEPMDSWDRKNFVMKIAQYGVTTDEIVNRLGWRKKMVGEHLLVCLGNKDIPKQRDLNKKDRIINIDEIKGEIEETVGMPVKEAPHVIVNGEKKPLKRGLAHLSGAKVSKSVFHAIEGPYNGWSDLFLVNQLIMRVDNGILDLENEELFERARLLIDKLEALGI